MVQHDAVLFRQRSQADGRSVTLRLTDKGNEVIARDPFEVLVRAVGALDAEEQTAMHGALHHVVTTVAASGAHRHFGVCQDCAYLGGETCCTSTRAAFAAKPWTASRCVRWTASTRARTCS